MKNYFNSVLAILLAIFISFKSYSQISCSSGFAGAAFVDDLEIQRIMDGGLWNWKRYLES